MGLVVSVEVIEDEPISSPGSVDDLTSLVRYALAEERRSGGWDVTVALVSDHALRRLHDDFLGLDTVTDILTFPRGDDERGGDIAISVERAAAQAGDYGLTTWEEICFLAVHGVLHLCGWDDGDDEARRRMLARQGEIIQGWGRGLTSVQ